MGREDKRIVCLDVNFLVLFCVLKVALFSEKHPQKTGDRDSELTWVKELSLMRFWERSFLNSKMCLFLMVWNLN